MPNTPANPIPSEHFHDGAPISCKLTDWTFTRYHTPGKSQYAVVYGTVAQDGSGRFAAGSQIRTSPVTQWSAPLAHTHNSVKVQAAFYRPNSVSDGLQTSATLQSSTRPDNRYARFRWDSPRG